MTSTAMDEAKNWTTIAESRFALTGQTTISNRLSAESN